MSFDDSISAGNKIIASALQSPNYAQGSSGWTINRDGSAEFQNVLVRGTITGSTIIGSTIIGGTVIGGIFKSSNFDNTAGTGFEFNATGSPDATATPPVPANTMQIYSAFQVGPTGGNQIALAYTSGVSGLVLRTGNPLDTQNAQLDGGTFTQVGSGRLMSEVSLNSSTVNGTMGYSLVASSGTTSTDLPAIATWQTAGETAPPSYAGVKGVMFLGGASADLWNLTINNENSVVSGGGIGFPAIIIGNTYSTPPQSRMLISPSEIMTITGGASPTTETLFLNTNNTQSIVGGVVNPWLRSLGSFQAGAFNPTAAYTNLGAGSFAVNCPASGAGVVTLKMLVQAAGAPTAASFVAGSIQVSNTTQGTTPFAPSDNRSCQVNGTLLNVASTAITVSVSIAVSGLGNPGDALTISGQFRQAVAGQFNIAKVEMTWQPSL